MADIVKKQTRSRMMAGIRGKDTQPELAIRRALHARGFRFRLHAKALPGRPDLVLSKHRAAIFVHGCFWHRHEECRFATTPTTRADFWQTKFEANIIRDTKAMIELRQDGWRLATIWECSLRKPVQVEAVAEIVTAWLRSEIQSIEIGERDLLPNTR